jgi:hypothetical protein
VEGGESGAALFGTKTGAVMDEAESEAVNVDPFPSLDGIKLEEMFARCSNEI